MPSTRRILPEKTVELWTALAILDVLGPDTWLWSRTQYVDQDVWASAGGLRKWFVLELKAPIADARGIVIKIDLDQLRSYVSGYNGRTHPDVLYVLPSPPWSRSPLPGRHAPPEAAPIVRRSFPGWAFVVRGSHLLNAIAPSRTTRTATIRCGGHGVEVAHRGRGGTTPVPQARTLFSVLGDVLFCVEDAGTALRSAALPIQVGADDDRVWTLNEETLLAAIGALGELSAGNTLFVGW